MLIAFLKRLGLFVFFLLFAAASCSKRTIINQSNDTVGETSNEPKSELVRKSADRESGTKNSNSNTRLSPGPLINVVDFFLVLPNKIFLIKGCANADDKSCIDVKRDYLKKYKSFENAGKTFLETRLPVSQSGLKMAVFTRPDDSSLIAVNVFEKDKTTSSFLEYADGKWADISLDVVPEYSTINIYEPVRDAKLVEVFAKKIISQSEDSEVSKKGEKLYDLEWKNGEFSIKP